MQRISVVVLFLVGFVSSALAQEFTPPPKAERDVLAAISKAGGRAQVDGEYRIVAVTFGADCTNDELKGLATCERLTSVTVASRKITDEGLAHLQGLKKLTTVTLNATGATNEGVAALRAALPDARVAVLGGGGFRPGGTTAGGFGGGGAAPRGAGLGGFSGNTLNRSTTLLRNVAVQDDLKLTPEQRTQISEATHSSALTAVMKLIEEKAQGVLTAEQKTRLKQLELQQGGALAVIKAEVIPQLKLTPEQVAAIQNENEDLSTESREILRQALGQRAPEESAEDYSKKIRDKIAEFNKKRDEKILALLTAEQRAAWSALVGPKGPDLGAASNFPAAGPAGGFTPRDPAATAKSLFTQYDTNKDGMLSEEEFPATNRTRTSMTAAGITLVYPVNSEVFVENYVKYSQGRRR